MRRTCKTGWASSTDNAPFDLGVTPGRAFVEAHAVDVRVRLGWLFDRRFPLSVVRDVAVVKIPRMVGPGVHLYLRGALFVTGAYGRGVEVTFTEPQRVSWWAGRRPSVVVSSAEPEGLAEAIRRAAAKTT